MSIQPIENVFVFNPDAEPPAESPIFEGFLSMGDLGVWVGREKHRKTNLVLQCAICAALGRDFLWFRFAASGPIRVVFIDYESKSSSLSKRYRALCKAMALSECHLKLLRENLKIIEVRLTYKAGQPFHPFPLKESPADLSSGFWTKITDSLPADLYIIDPMRCFHDGDENDSRIELLLRRVRQQFPNSAVMLTHHMTKANGDYALKLQADMRAWSDGARGSGAIKAHADVIICQERAVENGDEVVRLGAFMKDGADSEPTGLEESGAMSFYWIPRAEVPDHLRNSFQILQKAGGSFTDKGSAAKCLKVGGIKLSTAYRHLDDMRGKGLLVSDAKGSGLTIRVPEGHVPKDAINLMTGLAA